MENELTSKMLNNTPWLIKTECLRDAYVGFKVWELWDVRDQLSQYSFWGSTYATTCARMQAQCAGLLASKVARDIAEPIEPQLTYCSYCSTSWRCDVCSE